MRALTYARVSTDEQEDNYSLASQIEACRRYATERGMQVVAEIQDVQSGAVLERPGLTRVRELARLRQIDAVIVYALDRLSRNTAHLLLLLDDLKGAGVTLHTVNRGESGDTPEARMMNTIEAAFAEFERLKIKERMTRGKRQKAASGQAVGEGNAPYGYRWQGSKRDRHLVIVPDEADIVRKIYAWYIAGDGIPSIIERLAALNIAPPSHVTGAGARGEKRRWSHGGIWSILTNRRYTGQSDHYGHAVAIPAIIDDDTFNQARLAAQQRKRDARRNAKRVYLLRGRVKCAASGYALTGEYKTDRNVRIYTLNNRNQPTGRYTVNADALETVVWKWVVSLLDEETIRSAIAAARAAAADQIAERDRQRAALFAAREDVQRQIDRLLDGYARGVIDDETLARNLEPRKRQIESITAELERLNVGDGAPDAATEGALIETARAIRANIIDPDAMSAEGRRSILDALDVQVKIERIARGEYIAHCTATLFDASTVVRIAPANSIVRECNRLLLLTARVSIPARAA